MVQQHQYTGHLNEDPTEHMGRFLRMANTVKLNGVRPEVTKLHLFPFSLRDVATTWFESLPCGSNVSRFFSLTLTSERRGEKRLLCSSKEKMKALTMPGKDTRGC